MKHFFSMMLMLFICHHAFSQDINGRPLCEKPKTIWFSNKCSFDIGLYMPQVKGTGMQDFDISDCSLYGLRAQDPNSKESRFRIPLSNYFTSPMQLFGFYSALRWNYTQKVQGGISLRYAGASGAEMVQCGLIISPQIFTYKRFRLVADFELGTSANSCKVSNLKPLDGYHPYLRAHEAFDLKAGSEVSIENTDVYVQYGLNLQYAITPHTKLFCSASIGSSRYKNNITISTTPGDSKSSPATMYTDDIFIVRANEMSSANPTIQANLVRTGVMMSFGLMFDLSGYPQSATEDKPVKKCSCCGQVIPD